ncbi:methylcrotonoyl-CoA carboxylase subunit alpha, mitochondrial-like isoform X1 [Durio zibethinus]|uniref:non-specific serine/threonine protein kinase n=2 Tax=Durio zibethinus TaxID=66656 RepID=A0A6P5XH43_DURZI|nr:methylcrotonoyl-CoA carboxylase subunit alpha, mitochondrial-like isoform X1 [Durio zibethinus]XP_022727705.1 methylcrotonoyl-CoA carboxylase subunit alpha, mitochondrial-like isoform X1 [Durio zibethinus]XP_022727706.1 methylcrotonoyl-CoA carboxylase subunit alpha, mitochondrial-like isoform X1 [Durio zibethinus]XP_022727709.1 methylcrotonoyl-CoA carboxylase subunit alpha, mitochondrial-like isoform X1 [Durio zibethinus]
MSLMAAILRRKLHHGRSAVLFQIRILSSSTSYFETMSRQQRIEKILVANRGEIACRIMRTAKRLGIRTVAIYSDADKDSLHVKSADEAVHIGPSPARLSYLNGSSIVEAAIRTGAQAIHPGYGFLSESSEFAKLVEDKGLTFIGPPASAIRDMGDKSASKRIMGAAGVPLVPGYHGNEQDIEIMRLEADKIGYPILIKPTHGGGGKGMRIVQSQNDFVDSFLGAQREAAASFGINTILLEKYITQPRHIEVQIFGDKYGNVLHLYERDCSVQRRHQKIIEEAPAPCVTDEFRSHLGQAAVSAAKAVGYHNAGTVEFIVDTVTGQFYFMEMNTRLQVEHPVTEMIVGQDLVEWQICVANGEPLPISQVQVPLSGHAFEARIYAENVPKGFLPATGVLHHYHPLPVSSTVRVETGVEQGDVVSMHYDPMIAKLVVWGENRAAALVKLKDCLSKFQVAGVPTNINFLQRLANHRAFEEGNVETHFIEHHKDDLFVDPNNKVISKDAYDAARLGANLVAACLCEKERSALQEGHSGGPRLLPIWCAHPPFRVNHRAQSTMELEWENEYDSSSSKRLMLSITYQPDGKYFIQIVENSAHSSEVKASHLGNNSFRVKADGVTMDVSLAIYIKDQMKHIHIWHGPHHHHFRQKLGLELSDEDEMQHKTSFDTTNHPPGTVVAPMAGLVVKVLVEDGAKVEEEQPVLVLEAMKMEHVVKATTGGYVQGLKVKGGQQVSDGCVLFRVKVLDWGEDGIATAAEAAALRASFRQEVAVWHKLDHPNVTKFIGASMGTSNLKIPTKDATSENNNSFPSRACCVVVEYLPGGALKNFLIRNRRKKLAFKVVIQIALDLSRGLSYLHSKKIVHRDVKTENMLLDARRTLKIADFGVARVEAQNPRDMTGETGTLGYMAPEVLDGKPYNRKCDVYSFGICLWEIYCCDMPYANLSFAEVSSAVVRQNLRPEIPRCCPSSLASIMRKCWDAHPERRPDMDEVVRLLEAVDTSKGGGMIPDDQAPGCFCFVPRGP